MSPASDRELLTAACARAGHPLEFLDLPGGGQLAVLPYGGRVIGLWASEGANRLWTHPDLADPERGAQRLHGKGWPNSGGDRCWLAPERDLFFPPDRPGDAAAYQVPAALDPGDYRVERQAEALVVRQTARLAAGRTPVTAAISRRCTPCADPLPGRGLVFAGYALTTSLRLTAETPVRLGLWQLLQLPAPGEMLLATRGAAKVFHIFGAFAPDEVQSDGARLRWAMEFGPSRKIGVLAAHTAGRAGHLRRDAAGGWHLVVREFAVDPAGDYRDCLWNDPGQRGFAFQACLVDEPHLGRFNEVEHHTAAAVANGPEVCDHSSVLTWSGPAKAVRLMAEHLFPSSQLKKGTPCADAPEN